MIRGHSAVTEAIERQDNTVRNWDDVRSWLMFDRDGEDLIDWAIQAGLSAEVVGDVLGDFNIELDAESYARFNTLVDEAIAA